MYHGAPVVRVENRDELLCLRMSKQWLFPDEGRNHRFVYAAEVGWFSRKISVEHTPLYSDRRNQATPLGVQSDIATRWAARGARSGRQLGSIGPSSSAPESAGRAQAVAD